MAVFYLCLDPEDAKFCVGTPFKEQVIVGLDVCEKMAFRKDRYERITNLVRNEGIKGMMKRNYLNVKFLEEPTYTHYVWDVIAASILIDPTLIREEVKRYVDVNSQFGFSYGQALAFDSNQPVGSQQARIILTVDEPRLWSMIEKYCSEF